jgi:hypothetical protein
LEAYKKLKAENAFEVRKPQTTKELAYHNNQLLQQLLMKLEQMAHPAVIAAEMAGWSEAVHEQPQAPRMTAEEMEGAAAQQTQELLKKIQELEEQDAGKASARLGWGLGGGCGCWQLGGTAVHIVPGGESCSV